MNAFPAAEQIATGIFLICLLTLGTGALIAYSAD